jgi:hypothetical protein
MTDFTALRAEAARTRAAGLAGQERAALPGGEARREDVKFATEFRAEKVQKDGRDMFLVEGYASTTERAYEMWDFFGPYEEVVSRSAFDQTLARSRWSCTGSTTPGRRWRRPATAGWSCGTTRWASATAPG